MFDHIEKLAEQLGDTDAGWVTRRDAAENLGKMATEAVETLLRFTDDPDVDVKSGVERAAGWASSALRGVSPTTGAEANFTLDELVAGLEKAGSRTVTARGKGYEVVVELKDGRSQTVTVVPIKPKNRPDSIRIYTRCGKPREDSYQWALKTNMSTVQCAIALTEENGEEMLVMVSCFLADHVTPDELKAAVKEIAYYGDWIEKQQTGGDKF